MTTLGHEAGADRSDWTDQSLESASANAYWTVPWFAAAAAIAGLGLVAFIHGLSVIIFLAAPALIVWRNAEASVLALMRWAPAFALAFLALLSVLWSDAPGLSFRLAGMLLLSLMSAVIIADKLTPSQFIGAVLCGLMVVIGGSVGSPNYHESTAGPALAGLTGNKNVLGYMCAWASVLGSAVMLDRRQPTPLRWGALASMPVIFFVLYLTKSAGGMVGTGIGLGVFLGLAAMHALSPRLRVLAVVAALILAAPAALNWTTMQNMAQDFQVNVLKKDTTLTGRTYLWDRAKPIIDNRPILGHGYSSFWRQGQLGAEGLWRYAGIKERSGFNFHNEYVDTGVSLGYTGIILLVITIVGLTGPLFVRAIFAPTLPLVALASCVLPMLAKSATETGLIAYWSISTTILYAGAVYGLRGDVQGRSRPEETTDAQPAPLPPAGQAAE